MTYDDDDDGGEMWEREDEFHAHVAQQIRAGAGPVVPDAPRGEGLAALVALWRADAEGYDSLDMHSAADTARDCADRLAAALAVGPPSAPPDDGRLIVGEYVECDEVANGLVIAVDDDLAWVQDEDRPNDLAAHAIVPVDSLRLIVAPAGVPAVVSPPSEAPTEETFPLEGWMVLYRPHPEGAWCPATKVIYPSKASGEAALAVYAKETNSGQHELAWIGWGDGDVVYPATSAVPYRAAVTIDSLVKAVQHLVSETPFFSTPEIFMKGLARLSEHPDTLAAINGALGESYTGQMPWDGDHVVSATIREVGTWNVDTEWTDRHE